MPVRIPDRLPAIELLKKENIFVMDDTRAASQQIRPLKIVILNLMPLKITTETDLIRLLSNTPLQLDITFMKLKSHTSKNTPIEHMRMFYHDFETLRNQKFDGMIITGAPIEMISFEEVTYWPEIKEIFDWSRTHVFSTMFICWAAQAGLYHFYDIPKKLLPMKRFGIFPQSIVTPEPIPLFRGFDDTFNMPQSRHTQVDDDAIKANGKLRILAESDKSGIGIVMAREGREIFITGHLEYAPYTLDAEYRRDKDVRPDVGFPENYYIDNDMDKGVHVTWRAAANLFYSNWLNYYVYQETPYNIDDIK